MFGGLSAWREGRQCCEETELWWGQRSVETEWGGDRYLNQRPAIGWIVALEDGIRDASNGWLEFGRVSSDFRGICGQREMEQGLLATEIDEALIALRRQV
jgi:hypothetical protein